VDLVERAGDLKPMLRDFALSPRFDREFSAVLKRHFPGRVVTDESVFSMVLDQFLLQHRLPSGTTVVEEFVAAHPELTDPERDMLLGWRDVVEGTCEITGKERDALVLFNFVDELTYRARSNLGRRAFTPLKKGMILVGRLVRAGDDWMVSGNPSAFPASARRAQLPSRGVNGPAVGALPRLTGKGIASGNPCPGHPDRGRSPGSSPSRLT
jgi:hypothetical protein